MVRSFDGTPVDLDWLDARCADALWAPTAGNSAGVRMYTVGREHVLDYLDVATDFPYWTTDAAMATMALLLLIDEAGLQAALWGNFRRERDVLDWAGVADEELVATVLIGRGDGRDRPSASLQRDVATRAQRVRRVANEATRPRPPRADG
jgi:nitroreductase